MTVKMPYWPDRLNLCGPCELDEDHDRCVKANGLVWYMDEDEVRMCECHRAGHPTVKGTR